MALMKEFLLQQKELETQRGDLRRRLVDEVVDLQKSVISGNMLCNVLCYVIFCFIFVVSYLRLESILDN